MALTYGQRFLSRLSLRMYLDFLWKRLGRIYPLYIVVTIATTITAQAIRGERTSLWEFTANALMIQGWGLARSIGGTTWSISTEFAAYLLFPILVAAMLYVRRSFALLWSAVAMIVIALIAARFSVHPNPFGGGVTYLNGPLDVFLPNTLYPVLRCLAGFSLGLFAFRAARTRLVRPLLEWPYLADVLMIVIGILLFGRTDAVIVALFVPLVIALSTDRGFTARLLNTRAIYWLGLISYSIYLMHRLAADLLRGPIFDMALRRHLPHPFTISGVGSILLTGALSAATYYGIEKPGRDWARRLTNRRVTPIALEPSAP